MALDVRSAVPPFTFNALLSQVNQNRTYVGFIPEEQPITTYDKVLHNAHKGLKVLGGLKGQGLAMAKKATRLEPDFLVPPGQYEPMQEVRCKTSACTVLEVFTNMKNAYELNNEQCIGNSEDISNTIREVGRLYSRYYNSINRKMNIMATSAIILFATSILGVGSLIVSGSFISIKNLNFKSSSLKMDEIKYVIIAVASGVFSLGSFIGLGFLATTYHTCKEKMEATSKAFQVLTAKMRTYEANEEIAARRLRVLKTVLKMGINSVPGAEAVLGILGDADKVVGQLGTGVGHLRSRNYKDAGKSILGALYTAGKKFVPGPVRKVVSAGTKIRSAVPKIQSFFGRFFSGRRNA